MFADMWNWLLGLGIYAGLITAAAYLMRDTISKFFAKAVENRFEKNLEEFKAGIRDNERELDQIRSFLVLARRERDSAFQAKRLEAAETIIRSRNAISQLSMLVEYMQILNIDNMLRDSADPKIAEFVEILTKPFDIDEKLKAIGEIDGTIPLLYMSENVLKSFDLYKSILLSAATMFKILGIPMKDKEKIIKTGHLSKAVIDIVPGSKESFEKYGESYAYHWAKYFHDDILRKIRKELSGVDDMSKDIEYAETLLLSSRRAQINIRASLEKTGLSENLIKQNEIGAVDPVAAEKRVG